MSNQAHANQELIREARHSGFVNATLHMDEKRRSRLANSYSKQDARRERNISNFVGRLKGGA